VVFGRDFRYETSVTGTAAADYLVGDHQNNTLTGLGGADVMNGGGGNDILAVTDLNFRLLDGGNGLDTVRLDGASLTLDLTAAPSAARQINDVEILDLNGQSNSVTLNRLAVLNLSSTSNTVRVLGDATNGVSLSNGFAIVTGVAGVAGFVTYTDGEAMVEIRDAITNVTVAGPPIALDLDGDGLEFLANGETDAAFDLDGDGYAEQTPWLHGDDGWLAIDLDGDGRIADRAELSFASRTEAADSDLEALRSLHDSDDDGSLTAADAGWGDFRIWQDANSDGISEASELQTLDEAGIESVGLVSDGQSYAAAGGEVTVLGEATFVRGDGSTGAVGDVVLNYNAISAEEIAAGGEVGADAATEQLLAGVLSAESIDVELEGAEPVETGGGAGETPDALAVNAPAADAEAEAISLAQTPPPAPDVPEMAPVPEMVI
jgi:hypothetical protein